MVAALTFEFLKHTAALCLSQGSCDPTGGCLLGTQQKQTRSPVCEEK